MTEAQPVTAGDRRGRLLVGAQAVALVGVAWPGAPRWRLPRPVAACATALALGGAGLAVAGATRLGRWLRPLPAPPPGAPLRRDGPYGLVRHPIYAGLLLGATGVATRRARPGALVALAGLSAVLHHKARYEEQLLHDRFGAAYDAYAREVPRLVPRWSRAGSGQRSREGAILGTTVTPATRGRRWPCS